MFKHKESKLVHAGHVIKHYARDLFIPHEGNDHHPHALHHRALTAYGALLIALKVSAVLVTASLPASNVYSSAINTSNIISLTNAARAGAGLESLIWNGGLESAAQSKANDMALNSYFAHTSPTGVTPWYWIRSAGYNYTYAGENLAVHFSEAEDVTAGWMASPSHRANILEPRFKEIGVGVSYGRFQDYETTFVVEMFGVNEAAVPVEVVEDVEVVEEEVVTESLPSTLTEPEPEPVELVETLPEVQGEDTVSPTNVVVVPAENEYIVEVEVPNAESVALQLAGESAELKNESGDLWYGSIKYDENLIDENGEEILLLAVQEDGEQLVEPITYIAPSSEADDLYAFGAEDSRSGLLSFLTVKTVDDTVQYILLIAALLLGLGVIATLVLRVNKKHHSMLVQVMSVLILVLTLSVL